MDRGDTAPREKGHLCRPPIGRGDSGKRGLVTCIDGSAVAANGYVRSVETGKQCLYPGCLRRPQMGYAAAKPTVRSRLRRLARQVHGRGHSNGTLRKPQQVPAPWRAATIEVAVICAERASGNARHWPVCRRTPVPSMAALGRLKSPPERRGGTAAGKRHRRGRSGAS